MNQDPNCIFCRIVAGQAPSDIVYESEDVIAFRDLHPVAPTHVLLVPKCHVTSLHELAGRDERSTLAAALLVAARAVAESEGLGNGYRLISNVGADGGQTVGHTHVHLIGGKPLSPRLL
ncbi:MAG: HIT domain-containing protein [Bacillota bacterium]|nr:HIT domain-containing protein [Bacillota bacterium]